MDLKKNILPSDQATMLRKHQGHEKQRKTEKLSPNERTKEMKQLNAT